MPWSLISKHIESLSSLVALNHGRSTISFLIIHGLWLKFQHPRLFKSHKWPVVGWLAWVHCSPFDDTWLDHTYDFTKVANDLLMMIIITSWLSVNQIHKPIWIVPQVMLNIIFTTIYQPLLATIDHYKPAYINHSLCAWLRLADRSPKSMAKRATLIIPHGRRHDQLLIYTSWLNID